MPLSHRPRGHFLFLLYHYYWLSIQHALLNYTYNNSSLRRDLAAASDKLSEQTLGKVGMTKCF